MKNGSRDKFAFSKVSCAYEKSRLKQIFLSADYDQLFKGSSQKLSKLEREHSNNYFSELLLSSNIQRIEQLVYPIYPTTTLESMQPPLHEHNSVQGNPCFLHLQHSEHFCLHPHLTSAMHVFEASASVVQIGFSTAPFIVYPKLWMSYVGNFVCSGCTHMLKAI